MNAQGFHFFQHRARLAQAGGRDLGAEVSFGQPHQCVARGVYRPRQPAADEITGRWRPGRRQRQQGQPRGAVRRRRCQRQGGGRQLREQQARGQRWRADVAGFRKCLSPFADAGVELFGLGGLLLGGRAAHRHIAHRAAIFADRRHIGFHPVEMPLLGAVLDQAFPWAAGLDGGPEVGEGFGRHVRVAHDIVRMPDQFVLAKAADVDEGAVGVGDLAFQVGLGDDGAMGQQEHLGAVHGKILFMGPAPVLVSAAQRRSGTRLWRAGSGRLKSHPGQSK